MSDMHLLKRLRTELKAKQKIAKKWVKNIPEFNYL